MTYPFEFLKTTTQLHRNLPGAKQVELFHQFKHYFSGCGALNIGNALKSGSRFILFNSTSKFMSTENGKTSAPRLVIAGAMTGFVESLWIIPFENIKTTMIENSLHYSAIENKEKESNLKKKNEKVNYKPPTPKKPQKNGINYHHLSFITTIQEIYQTRGFRGFLQGTVPTLIRQCTNSAVRFGTYTSLRQLFQPHGGELNTYLAFAIGVTSSLAVVGVTQPIDVIKTRMQSREAYYTYKNFFKLCL
ncbi:unnamed protein product [Wickerhamomyces anomalus]